MLDNNRFDDCACCKGFVEVYECEHGNCPVCGDTGEEDGN